MAGSGCDDHLHLNVVAGLVAYGSDDEDGDDGEDVGHGNNEGPQQPTHRQHAQPLTVPGAVLPQHQHQQHPLGYNSVRSQPPSESMSPERPPVRSPSPLEEKPKPKAAPVALTGAAQLRTGTVTALVPTSLLIRRQAVEQKKKVSHFFFDGKKKTNSNNPFSLQPAFPRPDTQVAPKAAPPPPPPAKPATQNAKDEAYEAFMAELEGLL